MSLIQCLSSQSTWLEQGSRFTLFLSSSKAISKPCCLGGDGINIGENNTKFSVLKLSVCHIRHVPLALTFSSSVLDLPCGASGMRILCFFTPSGYGASQAAPLLSLALFGPSLLASSSCVFFSSSMTLKFVIDAT